MNDVLLKVDVSFRLKEYMTIKDLRRMSKKIYNDEYFLQDVLRMRLGIHDICDDNEDKNLYVNSYIYICDDGSIILNLKDDESILELLRDVTKISYNKNHGRRYVPEKAGYFRNYLNDAFREELDLEKVLKGLK